MTRDSVTLTVGQNEAVLLGGFLGRRDDASPIHQCPLCAAGSTGRRNTGVKSLCWGFKLQGLTWSFV
jgi:hypothetical protein